jgi:amidase
MSVLVKDCIDVEGLNTTAGSLALADNRPREDASVVVRLRREGAVVIGKTNQSELSGWVTFSAPAGYSALGGRTLNPYRPYLETGGSSSGSAVAVAAGYVPAALGTDTGGSILKPAGLNNVFGIRPTTGRIPTTGIIPVSGHQDTPGPIARSPRVLASVLGALMSREPGDAAFAPSPDAARGLRIGIPVHVAVSPANRDQWRKQLNALRGAGAELVVVEADFPTEGIGDPFVPAYDFREQIDLYLQRTDGTVRDFDQLLGHYLEKPDERMPYGADNLLRSAAIDLHADRAARDAAWTEESQRSRSVLAAVRGSRGVDMIAFPQGGAAYLASKSGFPAISLPGNARKDGAFVYLTVLATAADREAELLDLAVAYEANFPTLVRPHLPSIPTVEGL